MEYRNKLVGAHTSSVFQYRLYFNMISLANNTRHTRMYWFVNAFSGYDANIHSFFFSAFED